MNRVRIGLVITFIIGCLYSAFGVFESLEKFGLGLIVACMAVIAHGYIDYRESDHNYRIIRQREQVWARRDGRR
jgi:hypothetical protein